MKKSIIAGLALLCVCMIILGGCSSAPETKTFSFESPQKITVTSISGEKKEVTDEDIMQQITDNITSIQFERGESSEDTNGFGSMISWYDTNGDVMETIDIEVINDVLSTILEANQDGQEDWEDKALLEEYAAYGIEKEDNFYYYQGELVYIIKDERPDSSVYRLNTDSKGAVSIKVIRNAGGEITSVTYMTEEEVAKALPRILGGASYLDGATMEETEYSDINAEELADTFGIMVSLPENTNLQS